MAITENYPMFQTFYSCEKSISRRIRFFPVRNFRTTLGCDVTFYYPVCTLLSVKWSLTRGEKQKKISKVVAVAYERWSLTRGSKYIDLTGKLLVFWKTGR